MELGSIISSKATTPFWLRTNHYGIIPREAPAGIFQAAIQKHYRQPDSVHTQKVDWSFTLNPVMTQNQADRLKLFLVEANLSVRFKALELYVGRRRQVTGLGDTTLTSGFYAVSGNALPLPKIQLSTVGYAPLHFTGDWVAINAGLAHGWYQMASLQGVRLHQKYFYLRLGKPGSLIKGYMGLNHQVQWAGHAEYLKQRPDIADANGYFPSDWKFYRYVFFSYTPKDWAKVAGYTSFDSYRVGNSLGSIDIGVEFNLPSGRWLAYHQHAYDDVSGIVFKNVPDGLWGLSYRPGPGQQTAFQINRITAELLTTTNQSGATFYIPGSSYQGGDNYYNHSQYAQGWSYLGRTIGTPFIAPRQDFDPASALAAGAFFSNNRVTMGYIGAQAIYRKATLLLRTSYSWNAGTFSQPTPGTLVQFSMLAGAQIPITRYKVLLMASAALDTGDLYTPAIGGYIGLKKKW
ncbi:capsule assembly protein Wzi [Larkinella arboricola]|uniref:Capsule assembly protein Wzi n=2 Tax=Larkinella arboricola TaxID=643671 RepID=A0A327WMS6_LARAB|nr:capsule assembly protein Wzi [Larkinella arboricola]